MRRWPFVGRQEALDDIQSCLADPDVAGVVFAGDAGAGKTRLAREALDLFSADDREVVWVAATRTAGSIPFGAVAHLLPQDWRPDGDRLSVLSLIARHVRERGAGRPMLIAVDDAHLLDAGSAAVLAHLANQRLAFLLVTVRTGAPCPDAVTALWKDGSARRIELAPLPVDAVDLLLDHTLPGQLEGFSRRLLHRAAAGSPLMLRELILEATETGALARRHRVWRFESRYRPRSRIRDLLIDRLGTVRTGALPVLELLACGEPLGLVTLRRLAGQAAVEAAEALEMVVVERSGSRVRLRLAHPLYGEVLREAMPASRALRLYGQLADAKLALPMRRRDDALRAGLWQVEAGEVMRPDVVRLAAGQAMDRADLDLAERLAKTARDAEPCAEADRLLADILIFRGRAAEAARILPAHSPSTGGESVRWAITRALTAYWGAGDVAQAERVLERVAAQPEGDLASGSRSWLLLYDGRCSAALTLARQVLTSESATRQAAIWAAGAATAAAGFLGRAHEAEELSEHGFALAGSSPADLPWGPIQVGQGRCLSLLALGEPSRAWDLADRGYQRAIDDQAPLVAAMWAGFRGLAEVMQGAPDQAGRSLQEAIAALENDDIFRLARCFHTALAAATALGGDGPQARAWLDRAHKMAGPSHRLFGPWFRQWEAWTLASTGDTTTAAATCRQAAEIARATDLPAVEAAARYDAVRFGSTAEQSHLRELTDRLGTPFTAALATAAKGIGAGDGDALTQAGETLAALGHGLLAAEAFAAAARAYRQAEKRTQAALSIERSVQLRARCQGARTPWDQGQLITLLTRRERDVALLAAKHSSRQVAERLNLSTATVNNHLARVYTKLGISRRIQLATLLDGENAPAEGGGPASLPAVRG